AGGCHPTGFAFSCCNGAHRHCGEGADCRAIRPSESGLGNYEPAILLLTVVNVALALVPRAVMATRQTTIMRASITAYSTAVGPSSFLKNFTIEGVRRFSIVHSLWWEK